MDPCVSTELPVKTACIYRLIQVIAGHKSEGTFSDVTVHMLWHPHIAEDSHEMLSLILLEKNNEKNKGYPLLLQMVLSFHQYILLQ